MVSRDAVFHSAPADSDEAIVAFSGAGVGPGRFSFYGLLKLFPDQSKLLVRDPSYRWYNNGLPEVGNTVEEIGDQIAKRVGELGAKRIVAIGSSMGGYAAILFGCLIGAERVVALVPQTLLHQGLPVRTPPTDVTLQVPDLKPVIVSAPETRIDLLAGWDDLVDVFHAQRVARSPSVRVLGLPEGHSFAKRLYRAGDYWPFITELIEGGMPQICKVEAPLELDELKRIEDTIFAGQRADWGTVKAQIAPVAERYPDWAAPNFHLGKALAEMGDLEGAETALARAALVNPRCVLDSPHWSQARDELVRVLNAQGRSGTAELVVRSGLASDPKWWLGHLALGECLLRRGQKEEARFALLEAEQGIRVIVANHPEFAPGHLALSRALTQLGQPEEARSAERRAAELTKPAGFHVMRPEPREEPAPGSSIAGARIVHRGAGLRREIALTFDDGPSRWTTEIATVFEEHGVRATFFLRGAAVEEQPEVVAALADAGHELGNHLWSHRNASTLSRDEIRAEIDRTAEAIVAAGAPRPNFVRPPYFGAPERVAEAAARTGVDIVVLRSIGSADWAADSAEQIVVPVMTNAEAGDIVCLHDGISSDKRDSDSREPTVSAVKRLVPALLERGLRPVTVSQLLD